MKQNNSNGIGFFGALTITFIVLKLIGVIQWSWFWVLSPVFFSIAVFLLILFIAGAILITRGR